MGGLQSASGRARSTASAGTARSSAAGRARRRRALVGRPTPERIALSLALDRLARLAFTATLALGVAACGSALDPRSVGPCGLVVSTFDAKNDLILEPPYQATMYHRPNHVDEVPIIWSGTGWGQTKVNITGPGRGLSSTLEPEAMIENRRFRVRTRHLAVPTRLRGVQPRL